MKHLKLQLISGLLLAAVGGLLLVAIVRSQVAATQSAPPASLSPATNVANAATIKGEPSKLSVPSLNLDLSIIPGVYNPVAKTWTLSLDKVQYAVSTPEPNNLAGNTFIYGHYRKAVFASLHKIQPGALAVINTTNGHSFYYQLASVRVTNPGDDSVFNNQAQPTLTIQTCTGLFFQYRQLFTFNLVRAV